VAGLREQRVAGAGGAWPPAVSAEGASVAEVAVASGAAAGSAVVAFVAKSRLVVMRTDRAGNLRLLEE
jgi:hypothetical protein